MNQSKGHRRFGRRRSALLLAVLLPIGATSAVGAPQPDSAVFEELRRQDLRVATVAHRLATANVAICREVEPLSGLVLHTASQYDPSVRAEADAFFRLGGGTAIEAVVPNSAAAAAGFQPDDRLMAVNGASLPRNAPAATANASPAAVEQARALLLEALRRGPARLEVERAGRRLTLTLPPVAGCSSEVELMTSDEHNSWADGRRIGITAAMAAFARDEDELAALIAHELAHNIYGHPARLRRAGVPRSGPLRGLGKNGARVRATEVEADRASVYLMAAAGYDVEAAPRFWQRLGDQHGVPGIFSDGTHPGTRARVAVLTEAIADVRAKRQRGMTIHPPGMEPNPSAGVPEHERAPN